MIIVSLLIISYILMQFRQYSPVGKSNLLEQSRLLYLFIYSHIEPYIYIYIYIYIYMVALPHECGVQ